MTRALICAAIFMAHIAAAGWMWGCALRILGPAMCMEGGAA